MLAEDVDLILIVDKFADDGSREILEHWKNSTNQVVWVNDTEDSHKQAYWTDFLANMAHERGMDWILPADVDEFPYAVSSESIGKTLETLSCSKLFLEVWPHLDWNNKFTEPHRLPKVAYRWSPDAHVAMGSHEVSIAGGERGILAMRELQYRSFEHFCQKTDDRNATLEPSARARGDGWHHLRLENMGVEERRREWELMISSATIFDPIPTHLRPATTPS